MFFQDAPPAKRRRLTFDEYREQNAQEQAAKYEASIIYEEDILAMMSPFSDIEEDPPLVKPQEGQTPSPANPEAPKMAELPQAVKWKLIPMQVSKRSKSFKPILQIWRKYHVHGWLPPPLKQVLPPGALPAKQYCELTSTEVKFKHKAVEGNEKKEDAISVMGEASGIDKNGIAIRPQMDQPTPVNPEIPQSTLPIPTTSMQPSLLLRQELPRYAPPADQNRKLIPVEEKAGHDASKGAAPDEYEDIMELMSQFSDIEDEATPAQQNENQPTRSYELEISLVEQAHRANNFNPATTVSKPTITEQSPSIRQDLPPSILPAVQKLTFGGENATHDGCPEDEDIMSMMCKFSDIEEDATPAEPLGDQSTQLPVSLDVKLIVNCSNPPKHERELALTQTQATSTPKAKPEKIIFTPMHETDENSSMSMLSRRPNRRRKTWYEGYRKSGQQWKRYPRIINGLYRLNQQKQKRDWCP